MLLIKKILKESIPILLLTTVGGVIAGVILEDMQNKLVEIPGLLVLLPAILGMRGNISGALGSRLSSALHLGLIEPRLRWNKTISDNVWASIILNVMMSFFLGVVAYYVYELAHSSGLSHFEEHASILKLTAISLIAGVLAGLILTLLTIATAVFTFGHDIDPDNVLMPSLSTVGDILTIFCLLIAVELVTHIPYI